jgi:urease accessory protein UreE
MHYKRLPRHSRPAAILLKRAARLELTSEQRARPAHEYGHDSLQVGDVLVDETGGFLVIDAASEPVVSLRGDALSLLQAAVALGAQHMPVAVHNDYLLVLPGSHVHALEHELGLKAQALEAPFVPVRNVIAEHSHAHHDCGHEHHH